ncbi:unnamed protein product, partial [Laminaria digitata]
MNTFTEALTHPLTLNLGSWLLHFTWQGILIGLLLATLLRFSRKAS